MSSTPGATRPRIDDDRNGVHQAQRPAPRRETETKASFKTTEFFAFLAVLASLLIAALVVDDGGDGGFGAKQAWLYVTILTVGYMVSRGLAKSGSRDPYTDDDASLRLRAPRNEGRPVMRESGPVEVRLVARRDALCPIEHHCARDESHATGHRATRGPSSLSPRQLPPEAARGSGRSRSRALALRGLWSSRQRSHCRRRRERGGDTSWRQGGARECGPGVAARAPRRSSIRAG